jgi:4'-phosphopantetheinyl transferase
MLNEEERRRAARFRVEAARHRYVAARCLTRLLLARYTRQSPESLVFTLGARGKPRLESPRHHSGFHFNSAHTGDIIAVGVAACELGIDVESLRPVPKHSRLAARFCSAPEQEQLASLREEDRDAAFLTMWTCKEAYLKAVGSGIAMPLRKVEVEIDPPSLARINNDPHVAAGWTLMRVGLPRPVVCTVAIRGGGWKLITREFCWPDSLTPETPR